MAAPITEKSITLRIVIDEVKNKVVYAHAGKDFVDIILSFLTFPLGTIARLLAKESNLKNIKVGSLNTLYESVANLGVEHFWTETSKETLLQPRNSMEGYCQNLKLNIDDTERMKFFICENWECSTKESGGLPSIFKNKICKCGKLMNREIWPPENDFFYDNEGFVRDLNSYIIFDNMKVIPDNIENCISLPMSLGCSNFNAFKSDTVVLQTTKEIVEILKCSLVSETPLTDFFLRKKKVHEKAPLRISLLFYISYTEANFKGELIKLKVVIRKSKKKVLFVVAEEDFVDILLSFLTFPLGSVANMLKGNSCLGSIDNLYKSVVDLDPHKYLMSPSLKDKLVKISLAPLFKLQKQILPIDEVRREYYGTAYKKSVAPLGYLDPWSSNFVTSGCGKGFVKSNSLYMVTDDLIVTPTSSVSLVSFLAKCNISPSDIEERVIRIGKKECLSLLKASLISASALSDGLRQFLYPI